MDGYQGREKEAVILSLVRSNPSREVGFLAERRRLNVAVTRARRQVAVICDSETVGTDPFLKGFLDYLNEHGTVQDPNVYTDLPEIARPDESNIKSCISRELPEKKKDKKKQKSEKNIKKTKANNTQNVKLSVINTSEPVIKDDRKDISKTEVETQDFKSEFNIIIDKFLASDSTEMSLSSDLNSNERRLVHEVADTKRISHESAGEGTLRHIVLKKESNSSDSKDNEKGINQVDKPAETVGMGTTRVVLGVVCKTCNKDIPKNNIELHKLRCKVEDPLPKNPSKPKKSTKQKVKVKKIAEGVDEDDFDTLCEEFVKLNKVCNYEKCAVKVTVIGVNCPWCARRFCLTHSMAEVHGCGAAAKLAARQQISRDHKLYPGSGTLSHALDPTKRKQIKRKLDKKIGTLSEDRRPKKTDQ